MTDDDERHKKLMELWKNTTIGGGCSSDREQDYNEWLYDYGVKRYGIVPEYVRFE